MWPLGLQTLQIHGFELGPKPLEIREFRTKALQFSQPHDGWFLRYMFFSGSQGFAVLLFSISDWSPTMFEVDV